MSDTVNVKFKGPAPVYAHIFDAGFDLVAAEDTIIEPGETALVPTGLAVELPIGYELQVRPRSGITLKTKLRVQLGTVDSTYRGEIDVIVDNTAPYKEYESEDDISVCNFITGGYDAGIKYDYALRGSYIIRKGDRIAQAVIQRSPSVQFTEVSELGETTRGDGGFGSTGTK